MADTKITEKFEFKTEILSAYEGQEQRRKLRSIPRHYLTFDYSSMNAIEAQWLRGVLRMKQTNIIYIPMWHNPIHINQPAASGSKVLYIDSEYMLSLNRCDAIMIFREDSPNQLNMVRLVDQYLDGVIGLKDAITQDLNPKNTFIFPMVQCSIQPTSGLNYVYSNGTEVSVNFEDVLLTPVMSIPSKYSFLYDEPNVESNIYGLPTSIGSNEVLLVTPQWIDDNSVTLSIDKNTTKLDNDTGKFAYDLKNNFSYDKTSINFYLMSKLAINNFIRFFHRMGGRYKSFYMPTWVNDFSPCKDILAGTNFIYTTFDQMYKYYLSNNRKKKIVIFTKNHLSYVYDILTYTTETIASISYGKLILSSPISATVLMNNIEMLSYMNRVRLDDDSLQLNYETDIVAGLTIVVKEVDDS